MAGSSASIDDMKISELREELKKLNQIPKGRVKAGLIEQLREARESLKKPAPQATASVETRKAYTSNAGAEVTSKPLSDEREEGLRVVSPAPRVPAQGLLGTPVTQRKKGRQSVLQEPVTQLKAAAGVPLPDDDEEEEEVAAQEQAQEPSDLEREAGPKASHSQQGSWSVGWVALLVALLSALILGVFVISCPQHSHYLRQQTVEAQQWVRSSLEAGFHASLDAVQPLSLKEPALRVWNAVAGRIRNVGENGSASATLPCNARLDPAVLHSLLAKGEQWEDVAGALDEVWRSTRGPKTDDQGTSVLLACASKDKCTAATQAILNSMPTDCQRCIFQLEKTATGAGQADFAGQSQAALAAFLARCPQGVVLIDNVQLASPELVPVLVNALSERGSFLQDGHTVSSTGALYILTMRAPPDVLAKADEVSFKTAAKMVLTRKLGGEKPEPGKETDAYKNAMALRRRIAYVAPLQVMTDDA